MISEESQSVAKLARQVCVDSLRARLEAEHPDKHLAIEPDSGDFFPGDSFGEAVKGARDAYPTRISFVIRIGHVVAIHLGGVPARKVMLMMCCGRCLK